MPLMVPATSPTARIKRKFKVLVSGESTAIRILRERGAFG
jgi:hypothetical protein